MLGACRWSTGVRVTLQLRAPIIGTCREVEDDWQTAESRCRTQLPFMLDTNARLIGQGFPKFVSCELMNPPWPRACLRTSPM